MIRRLHSEERKRFVVIDKRAAEDDRLSLRAKGLLLYLLTLPDDWVISPSHVANTCANTSVAVIRNVLKELKRFGYAKLEQRRSPDNKRAAGTEWVISEIGEKQRFTKPESQVGDRLLNTNKSTEQLAITLSDDSRLLESPVRTAKETENLCERIYSCYPRKVGKPAALRAIARALKKIEFDDLLQRTIAYSQSQIEATDEERCFIPYPERWFKYERYNDDPKTWQLKPRRKPIRVGSRLSPAEQEKEQEQQERIEQGMARGAAEYHAALAKDKANKQQQKKGNK
jgi:hypothetical protein